MIFSSASASAGVWVVNIVSNSTKCPRPITVVDMDAGRHVEVEVAGLDQFLGGSQCVGEGGDQGGGVRDRSDGVVRFTCPFKVFPAVGNQFASLVAVGHSEFEPAMGSGEEVIVLMENAAVRRSERPRGGFRGCDVMTPKFLFQILHDSSSKAITR